MSAHVIKSGDRIPAIAFLILTAAVVAATVVALGWSMLAPLVRELHAIGGAR